VLVVDDEPTIGDVVARYLERAGYRAGIAATGRDALSSAAAERPDVVVLDSKWLPAAKKSSAQAFIKSANTYPNQGRNRSLLTIIKTAATDGPVRFTAPTVVLERDGLWMVAGGFQPVQAYDVLVANLDPTLRREPSPETPEPLLRRFPEGLTTTEVAALLVSGNDEPDRVGAEAALLELVAAGKASREPLGDSALWRPAT